MDNLDKLLSAGVAKEFLQQAGQFALQCLGDLLAPWKAPEEWALSRGGGKRVKRENQYATVIKQAE